jgi:hypothetical protein
MQDYVEQRDGGYYIAGTRIALDSILWAEVKTLGTDLPEGLSARLREAREQAAPRQA